MWQTRESMENGNGSMEANLVNSNYCSACGKYVVGIRVKVLETEI